jgi:putative oxidoreductase
MEKINKILQWLDENQKLAYSFIRMFLGMALFIRGLIFLADPGAVNELAGEEKLFMWFSYLIFGHIIGGFLIMIGFRTRLGSIVQIPILFGAVFIVHSDHNLATVGQSFELAVMVLVLLLVYLCFGSGELSVDRYFERKKTKSASEVKEIIVPS